MDIEFLEAVLPDNDGYFYIVRVEEPDPGGKKYPRHTAIKAANPRRGEWVPRKHNSDHGIFFTPFTFKVDYLENDDGDKRNVRSRDDQKLECRALWLDLDIGVEDDKYDDPKTALADLLNACDSSGGSMPRPTYLVHSGGGIHAYWLLDEPLTLPRWSAAAHRFKQWWIDAKVKFDRKCTADAARVLRVPGTDNMKTGQPRPCKRMPYTGTHISTAFISHWPEPKVSNLETIHSVFAATDETLTNQQYGPKYTEEIVKRCAVFKAIAADHGASCSEPLWKDVLQTVKLTEDGQEWAHKLSDGHEGYTYEGTESKLHERTHGKGILCSTFAEHYSDNPCDGCPLQGRGHSPLTLGGRVEEALPYQPPNLLIKGGSTYVVIDSAKKDDPPVEVLIARSAIQCVEALQEDTERGIHPWLRVTHATGGVLMDRLLDMQKLHRGPEGRIELDSVGLSVPNDEAYKKLGGVLINWHSKLKAAGQVTHLNRVQGWQVHGHGIDSFVLGDKIYHKDGTVEDSGSHGDDETAVTYTPVGSLEVWQRAATAVLEAGNPALHTMLAASMGAPLGALMGNNGYCASLSYYSKDSGVGKSTSLRVARSVWASPNSFAVLDDTYNGVMAKLKRAPYLPLMWDDPRKPETRKGLREMLFQVAAGRTKQRATVTGDEAPVVKMHTIGMVASNDPLLGELSANTGEAEAKRVLEIRVPKVPLKTPGEVFADLDENYGEAGAALAAYYAQHLTAIKKQLLDTKKVVQAKLGGDHSDRFYVNTITVSVVAAAIATRLGIVRFDVGLLLKEFVAMVEETRAVAGSTAAEHSASNQVLNFIGTDAAFGGIVKQFPGRGPGHQDNALKYPADAQKPWYYVVESSTGTVRFINSRFQEWYKRQYDTNLNLTGWCDTAKAEGILIESGKQVSLAIGDKVFTGHDKQRCTIVQLDDLVGVGSTAPLPVAIPSDDDESEASS